MSWPHSHFQPIVVCLWLASLQNTVLLNVLWLPCAYTSTGGHCQWWGVPRAKFEMPGFSVWSETQHWAWGWWTMNSLRNMRLFSHWQCSNHNLNITYIACQAGINIKIEIISAKLSVFVTQRPNSPNSRSTFDVIQITFVEVQLDITMLNQP